MASLADIYDNNGVAINVTGTFVLFSADFHNLTVPVVLSLCRVVNGWPNLVFQNVMNDASVPQAYKTVLQKLSGEEEYGGKMYSRPECNMVLFKTSDERYLRIAVYGPLENVPSTVNLDAFYSFIRGAPSCWRHLSVMH